MSFECEFCKKTFNNEIRLTHIKKCRNKPTVQFNIGSPSQIQPTLSRPPAQSPSSLQSLELPKSSSRTSKSKLQTTKISPVDTETQLTQTQLYQNQAKNMKKKYQEEIDRLNEKCCKLTNDINNLQEILQDEQTKVKQLELSSENKKTVEKLKVFLNEIQTKLDNKTIELQNKTSEIQLVYNQLDQHKHLVQKLQDDIQRIHLVATRDRDSFKAIIQKEYETKLIELETEKRHLLCKYSDNIGNLEAQIKKITNETNKEISSIKVNYEKVIIDKDNAYNSLKKTLTDENENIKKMSECKLSNLQKKLETEKEEIIGKYQKQISDIELSNERTLNSMNETNNYQINQLTSDINNYKQRLEDIKAEYEMKIANTNQEVSRKLEEYNYMCQEHVHNSLMKFHKDYETAIQTRDNTIKELEKINNTMGLQITQYRTCIDDLKEEMSRLKSSFLSNLNNQKESYTSQLNDKNKEIIALEHNLNLQTQKHSLHQDQTKNQISDLMEMSEKLRLNLESVRKERDRYCQDIDKMKHQTSIVIENYDIRIERLKDDFTCQLNKLKASMDDEQKIKTSEMSRQVQEANIQLRHLEKEYNKKIEDQRIQLLNHNEKMCGELRKDAERYQNECEKFKADIEKYKEKLERSEEQSNKKLNEITKMYQKEFDTMKGELDKLNNINSTLKASFEQQIKSMSTLTHPEKEKLTKIEIDYRDCREELEKTKYILSNTHRDMEQKLNNSITDNKIKLEKIDKLERELKDKLAESISGKNINSMLTTQVNNLTAQLQIEREEYTKKIKGLEDKISKTSGPVRNIENETKLKQMRDGCLDNIRKQKEEIKDLQQENERMKKELENTKEELDNKTKHLISSMETYDKLKQNYMETIESMRIENDKAVISKQEIINRQEHRISQLETKLLELFHK